VNIIWDINLTTIGVFLAGAVAFYLGVMRQRDRLRDLTTRVESQGHGMAALKAEHEILKEKVIGEYLKRDDFTPVVNSILEKIDQSNKDTVAAINRVYDRMLDDAKGGRSK
jgi:hypothetical protein